MGDDRRDGQQGFKVSDKRKRYEEEPAAPAATVPAGEGAGAPPAAAPAADAAETAGGADEGEEPAGAGGIPPADFVQLVMKIAEESVVFMGYHDDPKAGQPMANLPVASWHIDLLETLREKTKGNLTEVEAKLLEEAVANLKMLFVRASGMGPSRVS